jgi:hypothetical protein
VQVQREVWALRVLGNGCPALPTLVAEGRIEGWDVSIPCPLLGCPCVITLLHGEPVTVDSQFEGPELTALVGDVLSAILYMQV